MELTKMVYSNEWDEIYDNDMHLSIWPWSDLVSLVNRHCKKLILTKNIKALEIGCGAGANIPFFLSLGIDYYAIEGSKIAINKLHKKFPNLKNNIYLGDASKDFFNISEIDLIVDRASVTRNPTNDIKKILRFSLDSLNEGGIFIGIDWFSINHSDFRSDYSSLIDDKFTRTGYSKGQFKDVGKVHFSDKEHLEELFKDFELLYMEEKLIKKHHPFDDHVFASWNIVCQKK